MKIAQSKPTDKSHYGQLPDGWEWTTLGEIAFYKKGPFGSSITKSMFVPESESAIKVYEQKNAIGKDHTLGAYYISPEKFSEIKGFEVFPNDIIVSCAGTIGEAYVMPYAMRKGVINQALMRVMLYDLDMTDFYLLYFDFILKKFAQKDSKGTAIKNIPPFEILKQYPVPVPPLQEQRRIVQALSAFEVLIDEIEHGKDDITSLVTAAKSKILSLAISGKLVPQDPTDEPASVLLERIREEREALVKAGKIKRSKSDSAAISSVDNSYYENLPHGWALVRFSSVSINRDGERVPLPAAVRKQLDKKYDYYGTSGVIDKVDKFLFDDKLLLIGEDGANLLTRSKPIAFIASGKYWVNNHAHVIDTFDKITLKWLCCFINAIDLTPFVTGSAQPKLTQDNLNSINVPIPPLAEQERIVILIERTFETLNEIAANLI